jgi:hypothetical protein
MADSDQTQAQTSSPTPPPPSFTLADVFEHLTQMKWNPRKVIEKEQPRIALSFTTQPDNVLIVIHLSLNQQVLVASTKSMLLYASQQIMLAALASNKQLALGKLYADVLNNDETKNQPVTSVEYGFEIPVHAYSPQELQLYLGTLVRNLDWVMSELFKAKLIDNRYVVVVDPNKLPGAQQTAPTGPDQQAATSETPPPANAEASPQPEAKAEDVTQGVATQADDTARTDPKADEQVLFKR